MANGIDIAKAYVQIVPSADGIKSGIESAFGSSEAKTAAHDSGSKVGSFFSKAASVALAAGATAIGAAATGAVKLAMSSIDGFSEYEQLVGGAELMFGDAYDYIAEKAAGAYKTVQLSQSEYLTQVNGFAVGLRESLGGNEMAAAQLADRIVTAEADIVAATGNTQENVQNAFNGIMKSNYTMLDNLGLGIKPTKEGMQEVIDKVNEWNSANGNATTYMIDNLADCQAALVDYIDMQGMAGYASNEASETIQGSVASLKASWDNLVVGMSDDSADFDSLIDGFVESAVAAADNIIPRVETVLTGMGSAVEQLVPIIVEKVPPVIISTAPVLIGAISDLAKGGLEAINAIAPELVPIAFDLVMQFAMSVLEMLPEINDTATDLIITLADGISNNIPQLIPTAVKVVLQIVTSILSRTPDLITSAVLLIQALAGGIIDALPILMDCAPELIEKLVAAIVQITPELSFAAIQILLQLAWGILKNAPELLFKLPIQLIAGIIAGFAGGVRDIYNVGVNLIDGLWNGFASKTEWLTHKVNKFSKNIISGIKGIFGIHSPSTVFRDEIGKMCDMGLAEGITDNIDIVDDAMQELSNSAKKGFDSDLTIESYSYGNLSVQSGSYVEARENPEEILRNILSYLQEVLPMLANQKVVMDTGAVVGELVAPMDSALGDLSNKYSRGVLMS